MTVNQRVSGSSPEGGALKTSLLQRNLWQAFFMVVHKIKIAFTHNNRPIP